MNVWRIYPPPPIYKCFLFWIELPLCESESADVMCFVFLCLSACSGQFIFWKIPRQREFHEKPEIILKNKNALHFHKNAAIPFTVFDQTPFQFGVRFILGLSQTIFGIFINKNYKMK